MREHRYPKLSEEHILNLLTQKGVKSDYIRNLKKRKILDVNDGLYDRNKEPLSNVPIPVNKIVKTHRLHCSVNGNWWDTIFNNSLHNVSTNKWFKIQRKFEELSLNAFYEWYDNELPPIENASYFEDIDLFVVEEGHHRTCWAILSNVKSIKVKELYIYSLNKTKVQERKESLKRKNKLIKDITKLEHKFFNMLLQLNFTYENDQNITYNSNPVFYLKKPDSLSLDTNEHYLSSYITNLKVIISKIEKVIEADNKWRKIPNAHIRYFILKLYNTFKSSYSEQILEKLYKFGWEKKS
ncbi:hypothetical protein [Alkalihalobacterium bogoriense]|uniref:hypothetical protein n=1 Tax=Alkalihalobacterium bogoriense TaxID=246272 RepID=UPI00047C595B|nr:hypothetical protein [Alkalihalobacterium bogoriense]